MFRHKHWYDVRATGNLFGDTCMTHFSCSRGVAVETLKLVVSRDD